MAHLAVDPEQVRAGVGHGGCGGRIECDGIGHTDQTGRLMRPVGLLVVLFVEDIHGVRPLATAKQHDAEEHGDTEEPAPQSALDLSRPGPA